MEFGIVGTVEKGQAGIGKPGHFPHGKPSVPHMVCGPRDKQGRMCVQAWAGLFTAGLLASLSSSNQKTEESCMANIEANKGVVTQINVFTVAPENQQACRPLRAIFSCRTLTPFKNSHIRFP